MCELCITQLIREQNRSEWTLSWFKLELLGCFQRSSVELCQERTQYTGEGRHFNRVKVIVTILNMNKKTTP